MYFIQHGRRLFTPWAEEVELFKQYNLQINETQAKYEQRQIISKQSFMATFPTGTKYTVRCLDGGVHDRSTWIGEYASLEQAVEAAKSRMCDQGQILFL